MIVTRKKKEVLMIHTVSNLEEEMRDILTALESDEEISNLEEEEVSIIEK